MWGLPVIDAALRKGLTLEELQDRAAAARRWPGVRTLKAALDLADADAESPGESISRLVLFRLGLPTPVPVGDGPPFCRLSLSSIVNPLHPTANHPDITQVGTLGDLRTRKLTRERGPDRSG